MSGDGIKDAICVFHCKYCYMGKFFVKAIDDILDDLDKWCSGWVKVFKSLLKIWGCMNGWMLVERIDILR